MDVLMDLTGNLRWKFFRIAASRCAVFLLLITPILTAFEGEIPQVEIPEVVVEPSDSTPPLPAHPERLPRDPEKSLPKAAKPNRAKARSRSGPLLVDDRLPIPGKPGRSLAPIGDDALADEEGAGEEGGEGEETADGLIKRLPHNVYNGGVTAAYIYTGESFYLASGGSSNRRVGNYRSNLDIVVNFDTKKLGLWENGRFFLYGQNLEGRPLSKDFVGDFQLFSNLDSTINPNDRSYFATIAAYWYEHQFAEGRFRTVIGKQDANTDFALSDLGGDFVHSSFGLNPNIPLPTFPSQSLGLAAFLKMSEKTTLGAGVYDGTLPSGPQGTQWGFSTLGHGGAISLFQLEHKSQTGPGGEHPGTIRIGAWHHSDNSVWTEFNAVAPRTFGQNYGVWCNVDQMLWKESYGTDSDQGLGVFFMFGGAPGDRNQIRQSYGYGLSYKGLINGRDNDVLGAAVATAVFSNQFQDFTLADSGDNVAHSESAIELSYKYRYSKYCTIQPDLQFICRPSGIHKDAFLPGMRFQILF